MPALVLSPGWGHPYSDFSDLDIGPTSYKSVGEEKFHVHNLRRKVDMYLDHCPSLNLVVEQRPQGRCRVADGSMVRRPDPKLRAARLLFSSPPGPPRARTCRDKPTWGLGVMPSA